MIRALVFYVSTAVVGAIFAAVGAVNLTGEIIGPGSVLMALGGLALVVFAAYRLLLDDPAESAPDDSWVGTMVVAAVLLSLWAVTVSPISSG